MIIEIIHSIIEIYLKDPIAQTMGLLGMITVIIALAQKDDKIVIELLLLANLFWGTHFLLMWVYAWFAAVIISVARWLLSLKYKRNKKIFLWIVVTSLIFWVFTFQGTVSLFPIITSIVWAYWFFFLEKIRLRILMMMTSAIWLIYHIYIWSIWWAITQVLVQFTLIITIYRLIYIDWNKFYISEKISNFIFKKKIFDYGTLIFLQDKKQKLTTKISNIITTKISNIITKILKKNLNKNIQSKVSSKF